MTRGERDDEARDSQHKPDNPFIKFKNHVDNSVSSLLQGLIGLPSALSRNQSGNPRWADFDEDLRRRDELQAKQKQLKDSEARRFSATDNGSHEGATGIVKNYAFLRGGSSNTSTDDTFKPFLDLPLYSPVTESTFLNLRKSNGEGLWEDKDCFASLQRTMLCYPYSANFYSQSSLLPYLLFSPYSPLSLSADENNHGYCEAFEDLIKISNGRPMHGSRSPALFHAKRMGLNTSDFNLNGLKWLNYLHNENLLQQPQAVSESTSTETLSRPATDNPSESKLEDDQTEQDMYDRFLRQTSLPAGNGAAGVLETLFADIEKEFPGTKLEGERALRWIFDELKSIQPESERALRSLAEELFVEIPKSLEMKIKAAREAAREAADREQAKNLNENPVSKPPVMNILEFEESYRAESSTGTDKIVSTSTSSDITTHGDGSVESTVTVWKRFADGRETVTTTTHVEEPARDEDGNPIQSAQSFAAKSQEEEKKPEGKKGWFWN